MKLYHPGAIRLRENCANDAVTRQIYQGHMAMCTRIDRAFASILKKIDERALANDTIVVFTSDHGDTLRSHGLLFNMMRPEAESIRIPLLIRYPSKLKPRKSDLVVGTLDLMPTLLGRMGLQIPPSLDGRDLSNAVVTRNDRASDEAPLFLLPLDWRGVYTRRFTYCEDTSAGTVSPYRARFFQQPQGVSWNCLYDRHSDPAEMHNLFASPAHRAASGEHHEKTSTWMRRFGDRDCCTGPSRKRLFHPEDIENESAGRLTQVSGLLKGRPIDLL